MKVINNVDRIPAWLDNETQSLIEDIINTLAARHNNLLAVILYGSVARHEERAIDDPDPSDVDLLAILDSDDPHIVIREGDALFHSLGLACNRHLDALREVQVMFSSRSLQEWTSAFLANIAHDGVVLYTCDRTLTSLIKVA